MHHPAKAGKQGPASRNAKTRALSSDLFASLGSKARGKLGINANWRVSYMPPHISSRHCLCTVLAQCVLRRERMHKKAKRLELGQHTAPAWWNLVVRMLGCVSAYRNAAPPHLQRSEAVRSRPHVRPSDDVHGAAARLLATSHRHLASFRLSRGLEEIGLDRSCHKQEERVVACKQS